jgi:hypothetical protein
LPPPRAARLRSKAGFRSKREVLRPGEEQLGPGSGDPEQREHAGLRGDPERQAFDLVDRALAPRRANHTDRASVWRPGEESHGLLIQLTLAGSS